MNSVYINIHMVKLQGGLVEIKKILAALQLTTRLSFFLEILCFT